MRQPGYIHIGEGNGTHEKDGTVHEESTISACETGLENRTCESVSRKDGASSKLGKDDRLESRWPESDILELDLPRRLVKA